MPQTKKGRQVRFSNKITYIPDREKKCLTEEARHIYKMVETDKIINIETVKQEIEDNKVTRNRLEEEEENTEANPYQMAILDNVSREDIKKEQLIHWSILSNSIKYIDRSSYFPVGSETSLTVKPLD